MNPFLSQKFRFYSFISMALLVFVHGYNLHERYLQPWSLIDEPMNFTTFSEYFFANGIFRFRIPMLFAISGYLFALHDDKPFGQRIRKRVRTLLLPYALWSIIGLLIAVFLAQFDVTREVVYKTHLQPFDKNFAQYKPMDWLAAFAWPTSFQLWFLRCLFMYNLLYPLLVKGVNRIPIILFTFFALLWIVTFGVVFLEGEGLLFFTLGIWLCKKQKNIEETPKWLNLPLFIIIFILTAIVKTWLSFYFKDINTGTFFLFSFLHKITIFTGLIVVWFGCNRMVNFFMNKKWFVHLSAFSFIIYALHVPLVTYLIDPFFQLIYPLPFYRIITFIVLPVLVIAFCVMIGWILRKLAPKVYGVLTGGRGF